MYSALVLGAPLNGDVRRVTRTDGAPGRQAFSMGLGRGTSSRGVHAATGGKNGDEEVVARERRC